MEKVFIIYDFVTKRVCIIQRKLVSINENVWLENVNDFFVGL